MGHKGGHRYVFELSIRCGMSKGTCQAEAMSNSEKIKPVALAVLDFEGISQSVENKTS